jgi:hypothetical protein
LRLKLDSLESQLLDVLSDSSVELLNDIAITSRLADLKKHHDEAVSR